METMIHIGYRHDMKIFPFWYDNNWLKFTIEEVVNTDMFGKLGKVYEPNL